MAIKLRTWRVALLAGCATVALGTALPAAASAEGPARQFSINAQDLDSALKAFAMTSGHDVVFDPALVQGRTTAGVSGAVSDEDALRTLLAGTNLAFEQTPSGGFVVRAPRFQTAADEPAGGSDGTVAALVVTAQKKEENIQDVPIAISAFTEKSLEEQKIEGGFDLVKAVPNVTFSKNNFSGYNFSIRGIGTKAVSVTTDPGVAVSFNSTTLIRNRLFEQEYFDIERVEVLRGPQGTLYGRNATAGVINVISAKPNLNEFSGMLKGEVGNYNTKRVSATVNVPLVDDKLAIRIAGASTVRDGYGINLYNNKPADGRDLWSLRTTISFKPTDSIRADLIWERFNEDDNRSRTGKQLCTRDPGAAKIGAFDMTSYSDALRGTFSQGCLPASFYDRAAFGTPNGMAMPFVSVLASDLGKVGTNPNTGETINLIPANADPYGNTYQSTDLRALHSQIDATYRANADVIQLNTRIQLSPAITIFSQTAYDHDEVYSTQDYNRYATLPVIADTATPVTFDFVDGQFVIGPRWKDLAPGGLFCDPQLGCSKSIMGMDLSRAKSEQLSQEIRIQSDFDGAMNFSVGANYTRYKTVEDYYVFFNGITMAAMKAVNTPPVGGYDPSKTTLYPDCTARDPVAASYGQDYIDGIACVPIETNPIQSIRDTGRNYFLSRNPYRLKSWAAFGELYWTPSSTVKVTAGLRLNDDEKIFTPIPSETLLSNHQRIDDSFYVNVPSFAALFKSLPLYSFSTADDAYPALPDETRHWREATGRIGLDWSPEIAFTNHTLLYIFYSRGYKAGGLNPPPVGFDYAAAEAQGIFFAQSAPREFRPEFVNAFEVGSKNTLADGGVVLNGSAFYYDYSDYQVSKIVDRTANNENFDAKVWGVELEALVQPSRNLRINAAVGYLDTALANGSASIDVMNRTAGHSDWVLRKPIVTLTSNCIVPASVQEILINKDREIDPTQQYPGALALLCPGGGIFGENVKGGRKPS